MAPGITDEFLRSRRDPGTVSGGEKERHLNNVEADSF